MSALAMCERELLIFAAFWFVLGLADELAIDLAWLWLRATGRASTQRLPQGYGRDPLSGPLAVLIPAYREAGVIATTIAHALDAWPQRDLRLYVGCYANDAATLAAAMEGAGCDPRVRLVVHGARGPTTKADCLNRLYRALCDDEARNAMRFRGVLLQDAEDMVHPAALQAIDAALGAVDFVQLPVRPAIQPQARWIGGHYADEFTESHAKALVVRNALGAPLPAAGVGCGFARGALQRLAERRGDEASHGPFSPECLTEDYELGIELSREGRGSAFLRLRDADGALVATGSYFPATLDAAVRQKTRWVHGIAFQSWDRQGWTSRPVELWMAIRDRRGPLTALVLCAAYLLLAIDAVLMIAERGFGYHAVLPLSAPVKAMVAISFAGFIWRAVSRAAFTAREYGPAEGVLAVLRIPVGNVIAIMAGRRALVAYLRSLAGARVVWDKTEHAAHPASAHAAALPLRRVNA
ncbi:glycosyl transferase family protein [Novosphingobium sp. B 225]|uniref:glycosyl transferase family protein n=1 Tax=Novosphingobium sp. B 225 TaxID=1961849 RepID=UPI0020CC9A86|nr:glycosyl transferase family protein [Novosphingobium sp. B 225]